MSTIYAYCGNRTIPVYCQLFPGNTSDHEAFKETFNNFFALGYPKPLIILSDSGPYSIEILEWIFEKKIVPLINARESITRQNVKKISEHFYVNMDYIPADWTKTQIKLLMNVRSEIERQFAHNVLVYHARRANVRGIEMVTKHRYLILILDLLKIITAYKLGRPDWIGRTSIFTMSKGVDFYSIFPPLAEESGFKIFFPETRTKPTFFKKR